MAGVETNELAIQLLLDPNYTEYAVTTHTPGSAPGGFDLSRVAGLTLPDADNLLAGRTLNEDSTMGAYVQKRGVSPWRQYPEDVLPRLRPVSGSHNGLLGYHIELRVPVRPWSVDFTKVNDIEEALALQGIRSRKAPANEARDWKGQGGNILWHVVTNWVDRDFVLPTVIEAALTPAPAEW